MTILCIHLFVYIYLCFYLILFIYCILLFIIIYYYLLLFIIDTIIGKKFKIIIEKLKNKVYTKSTNRKGRLKT